MGFRGRYPFKQYIPSKPAKYGNKIWTLCDSKTSYVLETQIYTGKEAGTKPDKNQGMRVVRNHTTELRGHNICCDRSFFYFVPFESTASEKKINNPWNYAKK